MSSFSKTGLAIAAALALSASAFAADDFPGVGRAATPAEIKAWDIDVRPDFLGLPKGSGSVEQGEAIWEKQCASCHGTFGESNHVFSPLIGGVTSEDMKTGRVATLQRPDYPGRTTMMKVPTISTLYDYIRRAMPWNAPKSLSDDEVYAVLAYMLNLSEIVPADFVLDDKSIRDVQNIMPNRNGMTTDHALWPGGAFSPKAKGPDVADKACMKDCRNGPWEIASALPAHALPSHGNLADQNRSFGPVRGQVTGPSKAKVEEKPGAAELAEASGCLGCHNVDSKLVGPSYVEIANKYKGNDVAGQLFAKMKEGGAGVWGDVPMPPQEEVKDEDLKTLVAWILAGAPAK